MADTYFVSGASGQLGRRVVNLLLDRGLRVVAGTRNPASVGELEQRGASVRAVDFNRLDTVEAALDGVTRALLISTDAVGARLAAQIGAVESAARAGVQRLVYTSVAAADRLEVPVAAEHVATEQAIRTHFNSYTLLRNNLYAELLLGAIGPALASGTLLSTRGEGAISWVSREDCALAAVAALTDGYAGERVVDVSGPEALSADALAALFVELSGQPTTHLSLPRDQYLAILTGEAGVPAPVAEMLADFDGCAARGLLASEPGDFRTLTGQAPRTVRTVLEAHRTVWS